MPHLLPFIDPRPQFEIANLPQPPNPPEPPSEPPTKSINTASKTVLVVENDKFLAKLLRRCFEQEGYTVRIASNTEEGMRLYRDLAPFNVVVIEYDTPQRDGVAIDYLLPQTSGKDLASDILRINPSQGIILVASAYRSPSELSLPRELIHVPVLIDIGISQLRSLLAPIEVRRAMARLTVPDKLRLKRSAEFWVRVRGLAPRNKTADELLSEAQLRTLIGAEIGAEDARKGRHWNGDVDFVWYLAEAMRSISISWKRQAEKESDLILELHAHGAEGHEESALENLASPEAAADRSLIAKGEVARIFRMFGDDTEATQVLEGWYDGSKPNEIRQKYGLDEKRFAAAKKRIRLQTMGRRNGGGRGEEHGR